MLRQDLSNVASKPRLCCLAVTSSVGFDRQVFAATTGYSSLSATRADIVRRFRSKQRAMHRRLWSNVSKRSDPDAVYNLVRKSPEKGTSSSRGYVATTNRPYVARAGELRSKRVGWKNSTPYHTVLNRMVPARGWSAPLSPL